MATSTHTDLAAQLARSREALADPSVAAEAVRDALAEMVAHDDFPCLGARSVFRRDAADILVLSGMGDDGLATLADRLRTFGAEHDGAEELASFIAAFRGPAPSTEEEFEVALWRVLQHLHDHDDQPWAADVASDPSDPRFAFSFAGTPFFIVGLNPAASRIARRAPLPTIVFNLHRQFERLRSGGTFARMRTAIRRRDERLQGSVNPMVEDYGTISAARQYSGRAVAPHWRVPFYPERSRPMTHPERPKPAHELSPAQPYTGDRDGPAAGWTRIPPQTGLLVELAPGQVFEVVDPLGEQVSDLFLVSAEDVEECFSAGRTVDYNNTLYVSVGGPLWSNRSRVMATIVTDTVGVHDMTLTPCSQETFDILYPELEGAEHPSCFDNLCSALEPVGVSRDRIGTTLNVFMDVWTDRAGELHIDPPPTRPGDRFAIRAELPLFVGVTACSAEKSNNGHCTPIDVRVTT